MASSNMAAFTADPSKYTTVDELLGMNKNDNRDLLIKRYGDQGITGFLQLTGATKAAGVNDFVQYWEEERRHRLITCGAATGSSGTVTITTPLSGDDVIEVQTVSDLRLSYCACAVAAMTLWEP